MPRVIVKCRYYKTGMMRRSVSGLLRYIAQRPGVEVPKDNYESSPTKKQLELIKAITDSNAKTKTLPEFKDFEDRASRGNALEFISAAFENYPNLLESEFYLRYIATRPRADKSGKQHGLFSNEEEIDLDKAMSQMQNFDGNLFSIIVSIKREDAERLGYNNAARWRDMVRAKMDQAAREYDIPHEDLVWYGAFHNESHHPHIHLLMYSKNEKHPGYIKKGNIDHLRTAFGNEIFQDDLKAVYSKQTTVRNKLTKEMKDRFKKLVDQATRNLPMNEDFKKRLLELAARLSGCKGKHQYGYLPAGIKTLVDQIVDEIAKEEQFAQVYDLWYQAKCEIWNLYSDTPPEKKPLSQEKEFKAIRNALIAEADRLRKEAIAGKKQDDPKNRKRIPDENMKANENEVTEKKPKASQSFRTTPGQLFSRALAFANALRRIFIDKYDQYDGEDENIDKRLKEEIRAIKNGQNITM